MSERERYDVVVTAREEAELVSEPLAERPREPCELEGPTVVSLISAGTELAACYAGKNFPARPGYAAVFRAEAVGGEVSDVSPGELVFCMGKHSSYQRHRRGRVLPLPKGLKPEVAVFARMMGVSMSTLSTTTARPPGRVLVTGLGPVGHLAAKVFASCGYRVTACDPLENRRELLRAAGFDRVFPSVPIDDPDSCGKVDLVIECSGHEQAVLDGCRAVRKRGEVVLVGVPWSKMTDIPAFDLLSEVFHKYVVLRSGWEWELPLEAAEFRTNSILDNFRAALDWLAEGRITVDGLYGTVSPRDAQAAYQELLHRRSPKLVTLFDWRLLK